MINLDWLICEDVAIGHTLGWILVGSQPKCVVHCCRGTFETLQISLNLKILSAATLFSHCGNMLVSYTRDRGFEYSSARSRFFQRRGANHKRGGANLLFWPIFHKNFMKMAHLGSGSVLLCYKNILHLL